MTRDRDDRTPVVPLRPSEMPAHGRWVRPLDDVLGNEDDELDDSADWLQRDLVARGMPGLIAGPPKCNKTWLALDAAIAIARGEDWLVPDANTARAPQRVLVVALEDTTRVLRSRVWSLMRGRNLSPNDPTLRSHLSISRERLRFPEGDDLKLLLGELRAWQPSLVILDCLTRIMRGDPNATKDASAFTDSWARICMDVGAAVVMLHHTKKAQSNERAANPLDSVRGSGDLVAAARHIVLVERLDVGDPERNVVRLVADGNLDLRQRERAVEVVRDEHEGREVVRLVDRGNPAAIGGGKQPLRDKVLAIVRASADGFASANAIYKAVGGTRARVLATVEAELTADGALEQRDGRIFARPEPF